MKNQSFAIKTTAADPDNSQVLLEGQLIIRNAAIIKEELLSALANSQNLELIFKNVTRADMAFLQLLVSLRKSAEALEKEISIDAESSDYMKAVIRNSGFQTNLLNNPEV